MAIAKTMVMNLVASLKVSLEVHPMKMEAEQSPQKIRAEIVNS